MRKSNSAEEYIQKQQRNHKKIDWNLVVCEFNLSEEFMEKHSDKLDWRDISLYQKLTEKFITKHFDKLDPVFISKYQKLSEKFIEKNLEVFDIHDVCRYQKISEKFIESHYEKSNFSYVQKYQKLSPEFKKKHSKHLDKLYYCWLYKSGDEKLKEIKKSGLYDIKGDYVYAYKGIRSDRHSRYNFQYQYFVGKTYSCHADHNLDNENSFGLSTWTLENAKEYCDELIVLVKIHKDDLAALVHDSQKIRCSKFTVVKDVERN